MGYSGHRRGRRRFRFRIEHLLFALLGAVAALFIVANIEPVGAFVHDYLVVDSYVDSGRPVGRMTTLSLEEKLEEIDDTIELKEIEQGQLFFKAMRGLTDESPANLQRMQKRIETLEDEISELRVERDALMNEIREQPIRIITPNPTQLLQAAK